MYGDRSKERGFLCGGAQCLGVGGRKVIKDANNVLSYLHVDGTTLYIYIANVYEIIHLKFMNYILYYPSMKRF